MGKLTRPVVLSVVVALTIAGCGGGKHALRADTAQAATGSVPGHNCKPSNRRSTMTLKAFGTSCATARRLERLGARRDPEEGFRVAGHHWSWYIYSRAHGHTYEIYSAIPGQMYIQLTTRKPVS